MQENNFENEVRQKMEEVKINPSAEVWQKVALGLQQKKTNWRRLVWIFSLLFILGAAGIFWWQTSTNGEAALQSTTTKTNLTPLVIEKENGGEVAKNISSKNDAVLPTSSTKQKAGSPSPIETVAPQKITVQSNKAFKKQSIKISTQQKNMVANTITNTPLNNKGSNITYSKVPKTTTIIKAAEASEINNNDKNIADKIIDEEKQINSVSIDSVGEKAVVSINETNLENIAGDTTGLIVKKETPPVTEEKKSVPDENLKPAKTKQSPWKFGVAFSAGISTTRNGYLRIVGITGSDADKAFDGAFQNGSSTGSPGNPANSAGYKPSPVKLNTGFIAGVYAEKMINAKLSILTGLNYKMYSTKIMVGNRYDSLVNALSSGLYYRSGTEKNYTNRFHFIEVPVGLQWRITKQNKLPLYLYTGMSASYLFSTNALQFAGATGFYYPDKKPFKNTQFDFSSRLLFGLSKNNKHQFLLGPQLNFSLGKMAASGMYQRRNYSFLGIHFQKGIGKK